MKLHTARVAALAFATSAAQAGTIHQVPGDFPTIQAAIVASADGDTVVVAPGTYFEQIDFLDRQITVHSSGGAAITVIDGGFQGPVVQMNAQATRATVLEGFTITHGQNDLFAGGIVANGGSPSIVGNIISDNLGGGLGNGITLSGSSASIRDNQIINNRNGSGSTGGGGGGGITVGGDPCPDEDCGTEIRGNLIEGNSTDSFTSGGGIFLNAAGYIAVTNNVIRGNSAPMEGGGIAIVNRVNARIENNLFLDNHVLQGQVGEGGGLYWLTPSGTRGTYLIGNTFMDNQAARGSAVFADGYDMAAMIVNNMVVGTSGYSAVECGTFNDPFPPMIRNNDVFVADAPPYAGLCADAVGSDGNISAQPVFFSRANYRLAGGSPGVDAGDNDAVTEPLDLLGAPRISDGNGDGAAIVDMGAYETRPEVQFLNGFD